MKKEMQEYCILQTCRRQYICEHFGFDHTEFENNQYGYQCCDNCEANCECDSCVLTKDDFSSNEISNARSGKLDQNQIEMKIALEAYFAAGNECIANPNASLSSGLTKNLAKELFENWNKFQTALCLQRAYQISSSQIAQNSFLIIYAISQKTI